MSQTYQLTEIYSIQGQIELLSGLRIGAGDSEMHIGGVDNPTIKDPFTGIPYIPGSSLKGKIRSLLEQASGAIGFSKGKPLSQETLKIDSLTASQKTYIQNLIKLFGFLGDKNDAIQLGPTRISFSDARVDPEWEKVASKNQWPRTEVKPETAIDRIKGSALDKSLRNTERVPAGTMFRFSISVKLFSPEEKKYLVEHLLLPGLKLLELDALGGMGSRGYGKIKFHFDDADLANRFSSLQPFAHFPKLT